MDDQNELFLEIFEIKNYAKNELKNELYAKIIYAKNNINYV